VKPPKTYTVTLILATLILTGITVTAFEESGDLPSSGTPPDDDYEDEIIYDLQASWIFEGKQTPTLTGPSIFYGSRVAVDKDGSEVEYSKDSGTEGVGNTLTSYYIENSDEEWGGGEIKEVEHQDDDWYIEDGAGQGYATLITPPHPELGSESCGDGRPEEGDEFDCPEDHGLPANEYSNDGTTEAETTTTENLGTYSVETGRSTHTDEVNYNLDLVATEPHSESTPDGVASEDISSHRSSSDTDSKTYYTDHSDGRISDNDESFEWENAPDFYLESENELYTVFPFIENSVETIGSVTNYYTRSTGDYDTWEGESESHSRCGDGDFENSTCESSSADETICVDTSDEVMEDRDARTTSDDNPPTRSATTQEYTLSESGSNSYSVESSSNDLTVEVDRDIARPESEFHDVEWVDCDSTSSTEESCEPTSTGEDHGYDCPSDTSVSGPIETQESYNEIHSASYTFYHETIDFDTRKIFDTNIETYNALDDAVSTNSIEALFDVEDSEENSIKDGFDEDDIPYQVEDGRAYYSYRIDEPASDQSSSYSVSVSSFNLDTDSNDFISVRDSFNTYKVDGPIGLGDGFVAIRHEIENEGTEDEEKSDEWQMVGSSDFFAETETVNGEEESFVTEDDVEQMLKDKGADCVGSQLYCVSFVELHLNNLNEWGSTDPFDGVNISTTPEGPRHTWSTDESLGVCKLYQETDDGDSDLDEDSDVQCSYEYSDGSGDDPDECMESGNRLRRMEGPIVDEEAMEESDVDVVNDHREACVEHSECVLHASSVPEGTVANVAYYDEDGHGFDGYPEYEEGGDSPDWQVCLNINNDDQYDEWAGQWYDLDNELVGEYLRGDIEGDGAGTDLVSGADTSNFDPDPEDDRDHIENYWLEHPNPEHEYYNPRGGMEGTTLLADCGPLIECGDDEGDFRGGVNSDPGFFSFFFEHSRDADYHPQGEDEEHTISPQFEGILVKIQKYSDNNQLDTSHYDYHTYFDEEEYEEFLDGEDNDYEWYYDTQIGEDESVQYAYTVNESWVVDTTGVPFPAWGETDTGGYYQEHDIGVEGGRSTGIHHRNQDSHRSDSEDSTAQKNDRAFGNSLAVKATSDVNSNIRQGEGFWIDPDNVRYHWEEGHIDGTMGASSWTDLITFNIDLTGPDSGLGWDLDEDQYHTSPTDPNDITFEDSGQVVYTEIFWEQEDGEMAEGLQPPMCGDDRHEFLLEEIGESVNSERYSGRYACTTRVDVCFYDGQIYPTVHSSDGGDPSSYVNTQEEGEDFGRLKNDEAVCAQRPEDDVAKWYDQDYQREIRGDRLCRENSLYGEEGVRWFDHDYISEHPEAVTGGIDDSWNDRMEQRDQPYLTSDPDSGELTDTHTPVPTGSHHDRVAVPTDGSGNPDLEAYGFCGGDDEGEHLVTQEASTDLAETNRDVIGVASSSDYCIFDGEESQYTPEDSSQQQRQLYEPGETIDFGGPGSISCYDGTWYDTWPIVFDEVSIEVPFENRRITGFSVINPDDIERTFEVEMSEEFSDSVYTFSEFREETGTSFDVTVPPQSSENFNVIIRGEDNRIENENLVLTAESSDGEVRGEDSLEVTVSEDFESDEVIQGEPESVSGIGFMQIAVLTLSALMLFFLQS